MTQRATSFIPHNLSESTLGTDVGGGPGGQLSPPHPKAPLTAGGTGGKSGGAGYGGDGGGGGRGYQEFTGIYSYGGCGGGGAGTGFCYIAYEEMI